MIDLNKFYQCFREAVKKKKTGKLATSAKKEGGGSGQNHDLRFLLNSDKSQRGGGPKELSLFTKCPYVCFRGNYNQDQSLNKSIYN